MSSLSQAPRLGYLPSPHSAFQEYATHMARWPAMLNSKGSWSTCILQGLTTFLQCAFTAHRQPAIERPVAHAFQGMEQPQGDDLTGPEMGLGVFRDGAQLLINLIEQCRDQIHRAHVALLAGEGYHPDQRGGVVGRLQAQKRAPVVFTVLYLLSSF